MARKKKDASANRGGRGGRGSRGGRGGQPAWGGHASASHQAGSFEIHSTGFTLADEARTTSQHDHSYWTQSSDLRRKPVSFISAGTSEPLKHLDDLQSPDAPPESSSAPEEPNDISIADPVNEPKDHGPGVESTNPASDCSFEQNLIRGTDQEVTSPDGADASGPPPFFFDIVRNPVPNVELQTSPASPTRPESRQSTSSDEIILFKGRNSRRVHQLQQEPSHDVGMGLTDMRVEIHAVEEQIFAASPQNRQTGERKLNVTKHARNSHQVQRRSAKEIEEDALLADYIANMEENGEMLNLAGLSYTHRDLGGSEDEIVHSGSEDSENFPNASANGEEGDDTASDEEAVLAYTKQLENLDRGQPEAYATISKADETAPARMLAKQDPHHDNTRSKLDSISSASDPSDEDAGKAKHPSDDFDFMDWNQPSLRTKKGKRAQGQIKFNTSDSDLEAKLQAAFRNDRLKKSERKRNREELRNLGMLGKKTDPEDLRVKYPTGLGLSDIADEMRTFLRSTDETLTWPPMDTHARMVIHELANKFNVKSKSIGKTDQRRPVLYRTIRTLPYVEVKFDQAIGRVKRRYFPRLDTKGKRGPKPTPGRANHEAASYRDGEIVGGAAPELGIDNRGRNMLEKMGWSTGTALGASNNKGILQPVTHAMKRSKAGLG